MKVAAGPFADLVGRLERLDDRGRVSVLLELLGVPEPRGIEQPPLEAQRTRGSRETVAMWMA